MPHRHPVPMPAAVNSPLDQARTAFDWLTSGAHPVTINGRAVRGPTRAGRVRLDELRDRLHDRRCPAATRDAMWAFLVHRARIEAGVWTIACVGCALPALAEISRRLCRGLPGNPAGSARARRNRPCPRVPAPRRRGVCLPRHPSPHRLERFRRGRRSTATVDRHTPAP